MVAHALLTVAQCVERLGISPAVVYAALQSGALPGYRFGRPGKRGSWRVTVYDLDVWVQSLKVSIEHPAAKPTPMVRPPGGFKHLHL